VAIEIEVLIIQTELIVFTIVEGIACIVKLINRADHRACFGDL
jgi:hypothetical protein